MLLDRHWTIVVIITSLSTTFTQTNRCRAAFTFLGPTPYLSTADSPFPVDGSNPNFYLEDFEDGELNTPGIYQPLHYLFGTAFHGEVMGPSEFTSSVDADDGVIDGSGSAGHSFRSRALFVAPDIPQLNQVSIRFEFDTAALGYVPSVFGFVWTDGPPGISVGDGLALHFLIYDINGMRSDLLIRPTVSAERNGRAFNDIFLGAIVDAGIAQVNIFANYRGESGPMPYIQIDHVQYGLLPVPEPGTFLQLMVACIALSIWTSRRFYVDGAGFRKTLSHFVLQEEKGTFYFS